MTLPSYPKSYQYTLIKPSGSLPRQLETAAINASGQVVGYTGLPFGYLTTDVGYEYANGSLTVIQPPGATSSLATAINASGVGVYVTGNGGSGTEGFIDDNGTFTNLALPSGSDTNVNGINDSGVVVGYSNVPNDTTTSFTYDNGVYSTIAVPGSAVTYATGINNSGIVIGTYRISASAFLLSGDFIYDHGVYTTIVSPLVFGPTNSFGFSAINNNGEVIGNTLLAGQRTGFIYDNGAFTFLVAPDATLTNAGGINDRGEVVGRFTNASGDHAFVYDNDSFTQLDVPGALATQGYAINDRGQVAGTYSDATGEFAFIATPTDDGQGWSFLKNARCDLNDFQSGTDNFGAEACGNRAEQHHGPEQVPDRGYNAAPDTSRAALISATHDWRHA